MVCQSAPTLNFSSPGKKHDEQRVFYVRHEKVTAQHYLHFTKINNWPV